MRRLAHALAAIGCTVTVIYDKDAYRSLAPRGQRNPDPLPEPEGVSVHALESPLGLISPLLTQQLGRPVIQGRAIDTLLGNDFDVIHYHNVSLVGGPGLFDLGADALRIYTAHEHWLVCPTHILWKDNKALCETKTCVSCQLTYRRPPQLWRYTNLLQRQARKIDAFIALSQSSADNHRRFGFTMPMRVMPSFLPDLDGRPPASTSLHHRPFVFAAGRLEKIKGLQDIIPIFDEATPADLLIAGSGDFEGELRDLAKGKNVHFLGRLPPEDLNAYYQQSLALVAPSLCYEVFPLVALEAFRLGVPMIARNLGSYPEIIEASKAGFLFDSQTDLRAIINRLATSLPLRQALSQAARHAFETRWSQSASLSTYFDLISELAQSRNQSALAQTAASLAADLRTRSASLLS